MNVKDMLIASVFAVSVIGGASAEEQWYDVAASNDGTEYSVKAGSFSIANTKAGTEVALVVGRAVSGNRIDVEQWYVTVQDCHQEMGELVTLSVSGDFKFGNEFVFGAGNIASGIAELVCNLNTIHEAAVDLKGI